MSTGISLINEKVKEHNACIATLRAEMEKVIVGQKYLIDRLMVGLLANGHILLEGVPGLAKTLSVKTLAAALSTTFRRIQFTPTCFPPTSSALSFTIPGTARFTRRKVRFSPTSFSPTKSTARRPRCRARCWRPCRSARSRLAMKPSGSPIRFW